VKRRDFITLIAGTTAAWPLVARAQPAEQVRRVGILMGTASDDPDAQANIAALHQGLQEAGWVIGRNLRVDVRWSAGESARLRELAAELVALAPDAIVAGVGPTTPALLQATRTIPLVFLHVVDRWAPDSSKAWRARAATLPASCCSSMGWPANGSTCSRRSRRSLRAWRLSESSWQVGLAPLESDSGP
jgi:ABC-type uncharacterized transport system substrate-binding protein